MFPHDYSSVFYKIRIKARFLLFLITAHLIHSVLMPLILLHFSVLCLIGDGKMTPYSATLC